MLDAGHASARYTISKRLIDVILSGAVLVVLSPVIGIIATLVRWKLGRPIIFSQVRPGTNGIPFVLRKFRTMQDASDSHGNPLSDSLRLTPLGATLRRTSLDELPSLWNVLRGDMSLVGPRPLLMQYNDYYTEPEKRRFEVRPGVTGLAQIRGRNTAPWDDRLDLDVQYIAQRSLRLDIQILLETIIRVLRRDGVVPDPSSIMQNLDDERRGRATE